jgi:hypothetical protein
MPLDPDEIDQPQVVAEVTAIFHRYEAALMSNDVAALNDFFWADARVTRYGIADRQWGHDELAAFRAATAPPAFSRSLHHLRIAAFGANLAMAQVEFIRSDTALRGFQTQTWVRLREGWKIVAAHVSMIAFDG